MKSNHPTALRKNMTAQSLRKRNNIMKRNNKANDFLTIIVNYEIRLRLITKLIIKPTSLLRIILYLIMIK